MLTRRVVLLLLADLVSTTGTEMTAVAALPWFVLVTTGSPVRTGLVLAAEVLGLAVCGLPGGVVLQRLGPRRTLLAADGGRVIAVGLIPFLNPDVAVAG